MELTIDDPVLSRLALSAPELLVDLALGLYVDRRLTLGQAAHMAGMSQKEFQRFLGDRRVPVHYDSDDLDHDLMVLRERGVR